MEKGILSPEYAVMILTGIFTGTLARIITLMIDYRQIPSVPNGVFINFVTGFIAAALGSVVLPAVIEKDFTATTFVALAIQHFRDIRKLESESLTNLEQTEYVKRGAAYIDGIAKTYESRNYISLVTSILTVALMKIAGIQNVMLNILFGVVVGLVCIYVIKWYTKGKSVGDICTIKPGQISVEGSELYVDGMYVTNTLGSDKSREIIKKEGLAVVIEPKQEIFRITLENYGQRQAMLYEAGRALGIKRYHFTRRSFSEGKIVIVIVPITSNMDAFIAAVQNTPILENSRKIHKLVKPRIGQS